MEITGTITQILEAQSGESANGSWKKQELIMVEDKEQYPKTIAFELWGDKIPVPSIGDKVKASINLESREYNGRWYTNVKAWKIEVLNSTPEINSTPDPMFSEPLETNDLPF